MIQMKNIVIVSIIAAAGISGCEQGEQENESEASNNPIQSMFSEELHDMGVANQIENQGRSKEEAEQMLFQYQLEQIAIAHEAKEAGLEVTEEEAVEFSEDLRESLESGEGENPEEALESEQENIEQLGLSEDEYWYEFRTHSNKLELYREKLVDYLSEQDGSESGQWQIQREEIIEDFKDDEAENIEAFKESLGISS